MKTPHWGQGIAIFIGLFIVALIAFVMFTLRHPTDLVTADYYDQGVGYQDRIDSTRRAAQLGKPDLISQDQRTVVVRLPHSDAKGRIHLYRPSDKSLDRDIPLAVDAAGVQVVDLADARSGLWRASVEWAAGGVTYYAETTVVLP